MTMFHPVRSPLVVGLVLSAIVSAEVRAQCLTAGECDALLPLEQLRRLYGGLQAVHLRAAARVRLAGDFPTSGAGRMSSNAGYELWLEGGRYHLSAWVDPRLGLAPNLDVAFDGTYYQVLFRETSVLSYVLGDTAAAPLPLPNPFFLPVAFLGGAAQDEGGLLRLDEAGSDALWSERLGRASMARGGALWLPGPGGSGFLIASDGGQHVSTIRRYAPDGRQVTVVELDDWLPVNAYSASFPRHIEVSDYGPDSDTPPRSNVSFEIEEIELGRSLPSDVFSIPASAAQKIWDSDAQAFTKDTSALPPDRY